MEGHKELEREQNPSSVTCLKFVFKQLIIEELQKYPLFIPCSDGYLKGQKVTDKSKFSPTESNKWIVSHLAVPQAYAALKVHLMAII